MSFAHKIVGKIIGDKKSKNSQEMRNLIEENDKEKMDAFHTTCAQCGTKIPKNSKYNLCRDCREDLAKGPFKPMSYE
jgi:ribosomal protein S14